MEPHHKGCIFLNQHTWNLLYVILKKYTQNNMEVTNVTEKYVIFKKNYSTKIFKR